MLILSYLQYIVEMFLLLAPALLREHHRIVKKSKLTFRNLNMKNKLIIMAGAVATLVSFSTSVQAIPISGGISFSGNYSIPSGTTLLTATSITFPLNQTAVTSANGTFGAAGIVFGNIVTMSSPLSINPTVTPVISLWSIGIFSFNALTLIQSDQTATTLTLRGTGLILDGNAADTVNGQWLATFNTLTGTFSYSASAGSVPDGGMTVMLLGVALTGLCLFRKKVMA